MKIWYETNKYTTEIRKVEVATETEKKIVLISGINKKGEKITRSVMKHTSYHDYFPSFTEAKNFLIERTDEKIKHLNHDLGKSIKNKSELLVLTEADVYEKPTRIY